MRLDPHHLHDDQSRYRDPKSLEEAWAAEPISRASAHLIELGATQAELENEAFLARSRIDDALAAVMDGPPASMAGVFEKTFFHHKGSFQ